MLRRRMEIRRSRAALSKAIQLPDVEYGYNCTVPVFVVMPPIFCAKKGAFHWISSSCGSSGAAMAVRCPESCAAESACAILLKSR